MSRALFIIFIFCSKVIIAQQFNLNWNSPKKFSLTNGVSVSVPYFTPDENFKLLNKRPAFSYNESVDSYFSVNIINVESSTIGRDQIGDIIWQDLPTSPQFEAKVNKAGNIFTLNAIVLPFFRDGNSVKRINSFTIERNNQNNLRTTSTQRIIDDAVNSVLASGSWYKIKVDKTGVFKLDKAFFTSHGIPTNFDPRTLKIYGNGGARLLENPGQFRYGALQQNAIKFIGEEDGSFDANDYVLFYAQGPHNWYRPNQTISSIEHRFNNYSDYAYYFISFGSGAGKRVESTQVTGNTTQDFNTYHDYQFYEKDSINLNQVGRQWFSDDFYTVQTRNFNFKTNSIDTSSPLYVTARFAGKNAGGISFSMSLNGTSIGSSSFSTSTDLSINSISNNLLPTSNDLNFTVDANNASNPAGLLCLDYIEIKYMQNLSFNNGQMNFRRLDDLNNGGIYGFNLSGLPADGEVWNVADQTNAFQVLPESNLYKYQNTDPDFLNEFVAFIPSAAYTTAEYVGSVTNQNTRNLSNIDYVIITHPNFSSEASRLASFRRSHDGLNVAVVNINAIYNDFSSGAQDPMAIRDFLKHLVDKGSPLKYVLLFGCGSYDFKDRIANNTNFIPTLQSFSSLDLSSSSPIDDIYTMIDDTDIVLTAGNGYYEYSLNASSQMDMAIGRFPAKTLSEAKTMVDKTMAYYDSLSTAGTAFGDWRTKITLTVGTDSSSPFHTIIDQSASPFLETIPYFSVKKLYVDAFQGQTTSGGLRFPQVNEALSNAFDIGSLLIMYFGHGGPVSLSQERIFTTDEINNISNFNTVYSRLPVFMTITCDFTVWDIPSITAAGVLLFNKSQGGTVSMITTSRAIGVNFGQNFNENVLEKLLTVENNKYLPLGEALRRAKASSSPGMDNYSINLLGDPFLSLARPPREIRITKINGVDADAYTDNFEALDFVEVEGEVLNETGTLRDYSFNGKATTILYDKPITKTTLNNYGYASSPPYNFTEQSTPIFKGSTTVTNGSFKSQFYVPQDINYTIGDGKLTIYAENGTTDAVKSKIVKVGGYNANGITDNVGPGIKLYMNNLNFANGGITDRNPYFVACVTDSTGINATGVGIGHDIIGTLDQDLEGTIVMNEFYDGGDGNPCINPHFLDYQKGQVIYKLKNLDLGDHTIYFKVWDINNNSSNASLDFTVMEAGSNQLHIDKLLNWPNPFTNQTYFQFEHNCSSELDVMVQIFTISGKMVKTIRQTISAEPFREGYRTGRFAIPWDGLDDFGDKIGKGVYIYRVTVKGVDSEVCNGTASAIEKLVILK